MSESLIERAVVASIQPWRQAVDASSHRAPMVDTLSRNAIMAYPDSTLSW